jgi:hypothetical protein
MIFFKGKNTSLLGNSRHTKKHRAFKMLFSFDNTTEKSIKKIADPREKMVPENTFIFPTPPRIRTKTLYFRL